MKSAARLPGRFPPGGIIRVVSPAGPVDPDQLNLGVRVLKRWGYRVELAPHATDRRGYLAGSDGERTADLIAALTDPAVDGIICSRGGYGTMRLLHDIPWERLAETAPKLFVGFSDIGALQLNLRARSGWVTWSGPQVAMGLGGDITPRTAAHLKSILESERPTLRFPEGDVTRLTVVREGAAEGEMLPCCLSILAALTGTEYLPDLSGMVLCLEDINEPPYRVDRMLWQLATAGVFDHIAGLALGRFTYGDDILDDRVGDILLELSPDNGFPVWKGLPYGHISDRLTLPVGYPVKITGEGLLEAAESGS